MTRVLVLADSAVVRTGLQAMLREDGRFEPVLGDSSLTHVLGRNAQKSAHAADVVLAEVSGRCLTSLPAVADGAESVPLVLLTDELSRSELLRAVHMGARALLPRTASPGEILAAIEAAAAGLTAFGPDEFDVLFPAGNGSDPDNELMLEELSPREVEVLALMAQGLANKTIADRLNISEHTVKFHVSSILSKLAASSRTDAVTRGLKAGLLVI